MELELEEDEVLIKYSAANLQKGMEAVGGRLYLTNQRSVFIAHFFNIQRGRTETKLSDIGTVRLCWTRILNLLPIYPNSIEVTTKDGERFRLVVSGRRSWAEAISKRRDRRFI